MSGATDMFHKCDSQRDWKLKTMHVPSNLFLISRSPTTKQKILDRCGNWASIPRGGFIGEGFEKDEDDDGSDYSPDSPLEEVRY